MTGRDHTHPGSGNGKTRDDENGRDLTLTIGKNRVGMGNFAQVHHTNLTSLKPKSWELSPEEKTVTNQTISIGIDLGTTNSSVAINNNSAIEIVKKPGGLEYTPSVFGFDKAKNKVVGQRAYDALCCQIRPTPVSRNFKPEVKRIIGTPEKIYFERAAIEMSAEEISAEY